LAFDVFSRSDGSPLTEGDCKWPLCRVLKKASIARAVGRIGWHDLRHTFGTHLAVKGADAVQIQELMGRATLKQTRKYIHVAGEAKRRAIQVLEKPHPLGL
jgi:site-specific recombinase XerD